MFGEGVVVGREGVPRRAGARRYVEASVAGGEEEGGGACRAAGSRRASRRRRSRGWQRCCGRPTCDRSRRFRRTRTTRASEGSRKKTRTARAVAADGDVAGRRGGVEARPRGEVAREARGRRCAAPRGRRRLEVMRTRTREASAGDGCGVVEGLLRADVASSCVGARDAGQHVESLDAHVGATGRGGLGGE